MIIPFIPIIFNAARRKTEPQNEENSKEYLLDQIKRAMPVLGEEQVQRVADIARMMSENMMVTTENAMYYILGICAGTGPSEKLDDKLDKIKCRIEENAPRSVFDKRKELWPNER